MRFAYYPGCSTKSSGIEYGESIEETARFLGIDLEEIPDWNCCGATSAHATNPELAMALPGRNLALAERMFLDIVTPCPACFLRHRKAEYDLKKDKQLLNRIETDIGMPLELSREIRHFLHVLHQNVGINCIAKQIQKPLKGLKAVTYYGCYLTRPPEVMGFDNTENPVIMDEIMEALRIEVIDWPCKVDCCGGGLTIPNPEITRKLSGEIVASATAVGAEAIITACHMCQYNLDTCQTKNKSANLVSIFYFSELTALALGGHQVPRWLKKHMVNPSALLERLDLL